MSGGIAIIGGWPNGPDLDPAFSWREGRPGKPGVNLFFPLPALPGPAADLACIVYTVFINMYVALNTMLPILTTVY